jgi:hypothetical protein
MLRRLSFLRVIPAKAGIQWYGFIWKKFLHRPSRGLCDSLLDISRLAISKYHLGHEPLGNAELFGNTILALMGSHEEDSYIYRFHESY